MMARLSSAKRVHEITSPLFISFLITVLSKQPIKNLIVLGIKSYPFGGLEVVYMCQFGIQKNCNHIKLLEKRSFFFGRDR